MTATTTAAEAAGILHEVMESEWPSSREAMAVIGMARDYLHGELEVYSALVNDEMRWLAFDPDLLWFDGDRQAQAIDMAADRALDAAKALRNRLAEYRRREQAAAKAVAA